jgi:OPT family oligopeptide transporter
LDHGDDGSTPRSKLTTGTTESRRGARDASRSSTTLGGVTVGQEECRFEARFNASGLDPSTAGAPLFDSSTSSSSTLDEDETSDDSELHDMKGNPTDNSPYAQVRASVAATDNTSLSIDTPRMWYLSTLFAIAGSSTNLFFSLRYPSVSLTPIIALLLVHPLGLLWDQLFKRHDDPEETFVDGCLQMTSPRAKESWKRRLRLWLAQGRWNEKEHCCVYVSSNVSFGFAFATDVSIRGSSCSVKANIPQVIVEQVKFYKQDLGIMYQILLILSSQILGYSLAGITRRYLVKPSGMIWPSTLVSTAMFTALHKDENKPADGWTIAPRKFFARVFLGSVAFYFLPGLLFPALSYFNVITWFAPKSVVVANLVRRSLSLVLSFC